MLAELEDFIKENKLKLVNAIGEAPDKAIRNLRNELDHGGEIQALYSKHGKLRGFHVMPNKSGVPLLD